MRVSVLPLVRTLSCGVCAVGLTWASFGAAFERNATVVFLGDSITHQARWTGYVTRYYLERLPERNVRFYNAGVGGDTMSACLCRLDEDVTSRKPDVIVTMFGMNDVGGAFWARPFGAREKARKRGILENYEKNMKALAERLKADNPKARLVWCTPSIYDETAAIEKPAQFGRNVEMLAGCAEVVKRVAAARGEEVIDFNGPMAAFNAERQKANPAFTLVGPDRVHPLKPGAFFMACEFLRQQGLDPQAADPLTPWPPTALTAKIDAAFKVEAQLRSIAALRWYIRRRGVDPDDQKAVAAFIAKIRSEGKKGYFEDRLPNYLKDFPKKPALEKELLRSWGW